MKSYRVTEVFASIQGEGSWTGAPVVFVRFAGCNLDCPWCDTPQRNDVRWEGGVDELREQIQRCAGGIRRVVFTGGEPALQVDPGLTEELRIHGFHLHMETNGTVDVRALGLHWITVSPKRVEDVIPWQWWPLNELKVVWADPWSESQLEQVQGLLSGVLLLLQPRWPYSAEELERVVSFVKSHPRWNLGVQTHKLIGVK